MWANGWGLKVSCRRVIIEGAGLGAGMGLFRLGTDFPVLGYL